METDEVIEETTEETREDRSISELLGLESYDGLTDGEVRALIDYEVKLAKFDEGINIKRETATDMYGTSVAGTAARCEAANQVLQSIIESHTNYQGVTPTAITDFISGLEEV